MKRKISQPAPLASLQVTMDDVAAHCGIAKSTVSRALSRPEKVSEKTRGLVEQAVRELGYLYNPWASSPGKSRQRLLGVMISQFREMVFNDSLAVIDKMTASARHEVLFAATDEDIAREREVWLRFKQYRASAIISIGATQDTENSMLRSKAEGIPSLLLWESSEKAGVNFIGVDNFEMTRQATGELIRLGHRRIALFLGGTNTTKRAHERLAGYREALREAGLAYDDKLISFLGALANATAQSDMSICQAGTRALLRLAEAPTAFLLPNGKLAVSVLSAIQEAGLKMPEDVSMLCLGDDKMVTGMFPPISAMETNIDEMHVLLSLFLQEVFRGAENIEFRHTLPASLRLRGSCAPAPKRA